MHVLRGRRVVAFVAIFITVGAGTPALGGEDVVELRVRGRYYSEPATVRVTVSVQPDSENRTLVIQADGDRLFRSSHVALDGENGRRIHTVEFKNLPAGQYVLRAEVRSSAEIRGVAEELLVVGDADEWQ